MSFSDMKESVKRSIERYGTDGILGIKSNSGAINFETGKSEDAIQDYQIKGVISGYNASQIVEGVINIDDLRLSIQTDVKVKKGDLFSFGDKPYAVINVSEQIRDGLLIKTVLQLRKTYEQSTSLCQFSIGGIDGTEFLMDGIWSKSCIMFKA